MATETTFVSTLAADGNTYMEEKKIKHTQRLNKKAHQINLSQRDELLLMRYCAANKISPTLALKKIIHSYLSEALAPLPEEAANQLDLFSPKQMNIFDHNA